MTDQFQQSKSPPFMGAPLPKAKERHVRKLGVWASVLTRGDPGRLLKTLMKDNKVSAGKDRGRRASVSFSADVIGNEEGAGLGGQMNTHGRVPNVRAGLGGQKDMHEPPENHPDEEQNVRAGLGGQKDKHGPPVNQPDEEPNVPEAGWTPDLEGELQRLMALKQGADHPQSPQDAAMTQGPELVAGPRQQAMCILTGCELPVEPGLCPRDNLPRRACSDEHLSLAQQLSSLSLYGNNGTYRALANTSEAHSGTEVQMAGRGSVRVTSVSKGHLLPEEQGGGDGADKDRRAGDTASASSASSGSKRSAGSASSGSKRSAEEGADTATPTKKAKRALQMAQDVSPLCSACNAEVEVGVDVCEVCRGVQRAQAAVGSAFQVTPARRGTVAEGGTFTGGQWGAAAPNLTQLHQLVQAPTLQSGGLSHILRFVKAYRKYEGELSLLRSQGYHVKPRSTKACMEPKVLQTLCRYELGLKSRDAWLDVSEEQVREFLWGRASDLSEQERRDWAAHVQARLHMDTKGSRLDAALKMFEQLEDLLGMGAEEVLTEKKQCSLVIAALQPTNLRENVKKSIDTLPEHDKAKRELGRLYALVRKEASFHDRMMAAQAEGNSQDGGGGVPQQKRNKFKKPKFDANGNSQEAGRRVDSRSTSTGGGGDERKPNFKNREKQLRQNRGGKEGLASAGMSFREKREVFKKNLCFKCKKPGHIADACPGGGDRAARRAGSAAADPVDLGGTVVLNHEFSMDFEWDGGSTFSNMSEEMLRKAQAGGVEVKMIPYDTPQVVEMATDATVTVTHYVHLDLLLATEVGRVQLRQVTVDIMPGAGRIFLVGRPELASLGYHNPSAMLQRRCEQEEREACARRVRPLPPNAVTVEDNWSSDDEDDDSINDSTFPPAQRATPAARSSAEPGQGTTPAERLRAAMKVMIERAGSNGAPAAFIEAIERGTLNRWADQFKLVMEDLPPAKVEPLKVVFFDNVRLPRGYATRKYSPEHRTAMHNEVEDLFRVGIVVAASGGEVISCTHMVRKPSGRGWRMTVDYRKINACTVPMPFPLPRIDDVLQYVSEAKYFGSLDLLKGFWQFPLHEDSRWPFAFATHEGTWEWTRVPMGARNAATHFQKVMSRMFQRAGLLHRGVLVFMDDIFVYSKTVDGLLALWDRVFEVLREHNIFVTPEKCDLYAERIVWCGHMISADGVEADPKRLAALQAVPTPTTAAELQQFLAAANWLRDKIPDFATVALPLQNMLNTCLAGSKRTKAVASGLKLAAHGWTPGHAAQFDRLKQAIAAAVRLTHPRDDYDVVLSTDASDYAWGAVITQVPQGWVTSGKPASEWPHEPLAFYSGSFRDAKMKWHTVDKEASAIHRACILGEHLLHRERGFRILTDHRNLLYIFDPKGRPANTTKATVGRLDRWAMELGVFNYVVEHISGPENDWGDMLSRWGAGCSPAPAARRAARRVSVLIPSKRGAVIFDDEWDGELTSPKDEEWPSGLQIKEAQQGVPAAEVPAGLTLSAEDDLLRTEEGRVWVPGPQQGGGTLRLRLLVVGHAGAAGHRGSELTQQELQARFWWPALEADVKTFTGVCLQCVKVAGGTTLPRPLGEQIIPDRPMQVIHFDYLHMGCKSDTGLVYVLVIKCGFCHIVELVACAEATAEAAAEALMGWFSRYGVPEVWISDQGPHFKNQLMDAVKRATKTVHHFTTPHSPWANGGVERVNREVLRVMRALLSENQMPDSQWPYLLRTLQSTLNTTKTRRLAGASPIEVNTGVQQPHPLDTVVIPNPRAKTVAEKARGVKVLKGEARVREYLGELTSALADMHVRVAAAGGQQRAANRNAADPTAERQMAAAERRLRAAKRKGAEKRGLRVHAGFKVGDFVLCARTDPGKLSMRWAGPMRVTRVIDNWTFEVEDLVHGRRAVRHAQMLKPYSDKELEVTAQLREQLQHDDGTSFKVQEIISWRLQQRRVELLVRWVGFDEATDSWQPFVGLAEDVPDIVRKYCTAQAQSAGTKPLLAAAKKAKLL